MEIKQANRLLREIREEWHKPIKSQRKRSEGIVRAYERWAFDEIYIFMVTHESGNPIIATQELLEEAEDKAARATTEDMNLMFSVLADICREVSDVMRLMEGE